MKIKHLLGILVFAAAVLVLGCGGGDPGLQNINATQVYTTAGYTIDTAVKTRPSSTTPSVPTSPVATH
jgi:hypothetical protein